MGCYTLLPFSSNFLLLPVNILLYSLTSPITSSAQTNVTSRFISQKHGLLNFTELRGGIQITKNFRPHLKKICHLFTGPPTARRHNSSCDFPANNAVMAPFSCEDSEGLWRLRVFAKSKNSSIVAI